MRKGQAAPRTWLLLVHQLPAHPSNLRVQTWRRLQQIGAIAGAAASLAAAPVLSGTPPLTYR